MSREHDPFIGRQLGNYQVQSILGEGGMARVYKAYHPRLHREVAIKIILSQIADRADFQVRFEREAQVVALRPAEVQLLLLLEEPLSAQDVDDFLLAFQEAVAREQVIGQFAGVDG